ncbi:MlaE family lipid ABC transporter permease subunit [Thioalkalivibrio sp. ALJ1]|uniref:MlaE family lipid ABC transporter permease subunit n=1 Tax=Thioalkalivibrio sp. ALJ1 TaxID=1158144 RepID=UPI00056E367E|nr:MlaE family lipid ABC transporter permease subunit [Thioalkalivibrio sp. ALJ1]
MDLPAAGSGQPFEYDATAGSPSRLRLGGRLDVHAVEHVWGVLRREAKQLGAGGSPVVVDVSGVEYCDGAGAALLHALEQDLARAGAEVRMEGVGRMVQEQLTPYRELDDMEPARDGSGRGGWSGLLDGVDSVGRAAYSLFGFVGELTRAIGSALRHPRQVRWGDTLRVAEAAGFQALPIVSLIAFLLGVILAFQSAIAMRQFGGEIFVANLVAVSLFRELGPLMMAILLAGRSGAAFAAEIGTMKVNEEVNALKTMGLDPVRFLVLPKVLAGLLVAPLLALYANMIGLIGAAVVMQGFGIPWVAFFNQVTSALSASDLFSGLVKAVVFGLVIAAVGCLRGLQTGSGAASVGLSTTSAVVTSIILIVVLDGVFAVLFYHLGV